MKKSYTISSKVFLWSGEQVAWRFAGVDKKTAADITERFGKNRRGFGSIPVEVTIGKTTWKTSIFPDSKSGTYLLPLKASVRKAEGLYADDVVKIKLKIGT